MRTRGIITRWATLLGVAASSTSAPVAAAGLAAGVPVANASFRGYDASGCVNTEVTVFVIGGSVGRQGSGRARLHLLASAVDECRGRDVLDTEAKAELEPGAFVVSPDLGTATLTALVRAKGRSGRDAAVTVNITWTATEPAVAADVDVSPEGPGRWSRAPAHRILRLAGATGTVSDGVANLTSSPAFDAALSLTQARAAGKNG